MMSEISEENGVGRDAYRAKRKRNKSIIISVIFIIVFSAGIFGAAKAGLFVRFKNELEKMIPDYSEEEPVKTEQISTVADADTEKAESTVENFVSEMLNMEPENASEYMDSGKFFRDLEYTDKDEFLRIIRKEIRNTRGFSASQLNEMIEKALAKYREALDFQYTVEKSGAECICVLEYNYINVYTVKNIVNNAIAEEGGSVSSVKQYIDDSDMPSGERMSIKISVIPKFDKWFVMTDKRDIKTILELFVEES